MPTPRATYRLQLTPSFGFAQAQQVVPYLADLGISHVYLSPIAEARRGSSHGYDVTDPNRIRAELGGESGFLALARTVRARGMGLLLDIVPNHLAASTQNPYWRDVLTRGRQSRFAHWFEIRWNENSGRIVIPVLGAPRSDLEARGELKEVAGELAYHEHRFPLPATHYELTYWKEGMPRVNWRRYSDINELVCLRTHDEAVLTATHELILQLVRDRLVDGLRVDHVDGLLDPAAYLHWLRAAAGPECWIVVERSEAAPLAWPVDGTTGYDFLRIANAMMHDRDGLARIRALHRRFVGTPPESREALLALVERDLLAPEARAARGDAARLRQFAVARDSKAIEDTLFYRDGALLSLCELGCDPDAEIPEYQELESELARRPARTLSATQTHDTKRGEDARARLAALTAMATEFEERVRCWERIAAPFVGRVGKHFEWLLYQTLLATWPIGTERLCDHLVKAAREAKVHTNWYDPNPGYEGAVCAFAKALLMHGPFLADFEPFAKKVAEHGVVLSLAQLGLKLLAPGVVDIYQGSELWDLSLVDPDNRRPVDFDLRRRLLAELDQGGGEGGGEGKGKGGDVLDPRRKLRLLRDGLWARRREAGRLGVGELGR